MRTLFIACLFSCCALVARAQELVFEKLPVQVNLDHSTFAYDATTSLVEIYLAFEAAGLEYESTGGAFLARLPIDVALYRGTDAILEGTPATPVWADSVQLHFSVRDTAALESGQQFVHQVRAVAPPGEYELRVVLPAQGSRPELALRRDVIVPDYADATTTRISDVTLASQISQGTDPQDPFYKNGLIIRPNASQLYGEGLPRLFYYAEVYDPALVSEAETYTLLTYVAEANRPQAMQGLERRTSRPVRAVDVVVGSFNLADLPSGPYALRMVLLNAANEAVVERQQRFFVYNPTLDASTPGTPIETTFETSAYAVMPQQEVERMLLHIQPIMSEGDRRRARNLSELDPQRRFLMDFWAVRDPNPATEVNEYKNEFYQRLQYAEDRYTSGGTEGWRTDRGRVLLKYGLPSSIDPHLFDRETKPYEIWAYNNIPGEGQAQFIFYDARGFGDFELLHSSVTGERKNPDWQRALVR